MIIDRFHDCYNATFKINNRFLNKVRLPAVLRLLIQLSSNLIIPLVFRSETHNSNYSLKSNETKQTDLIVSLTSFPQRIGKVHLAIESILRQTHRPSRIVLWLSKEQFSSIDVLPPKLLDLRSRGLEIILTEGDLRSYKKYYFLLKQEPSSNFIIIDDDIFYRSNMIQNLLNSFKTHPNTVCANRCVVIDQNKKYSEWSMLRGSTIESRLDLLPTGCGGVLYPANSLHNDALNSSLFTEICADADDIWLNCCAYLNKTPITYTGCNDYLLSINSKNNIHLHTKNLGLSNNDMRIEQVKKHYQNQININVFSRNIN